MPKTEADGVLVPFFKGLLAMLLKLCALVTAVLGSFLSFENKVFHPLSFWQVTFLAGLRAVIVSVVNTVGLEELAVVLGTIFVTTTLAAACCFPFEYVMIQIKKMQPDAKGKYPYTGFVDCAVKTFKAGGPLKFYTGFPIYWARIFLEVTMARIISNQMGKKQ